MIYRSSFVFVLFFFNDTATTEIYTLSLHDALPILPARADDGFDHLERVIDLRRLGREDLVHDVDLARVDQRLAVEAQDRKSTRLNSSHANISYAVFCLKKKDLSSFPSPVHYCFLPK